jgi:transposase
MTKHNEVLRMQLVTSYVEHKSYSAVARQHGVDVSTVKRWVQRHKALQPLHSKPRSGRPRLLTPAAASTAKDAMVERGLTASEAARELHMQGHVPRVAHKSTVSRAVHKEAERADRPVTVHRGQPDKQLTTDTKQKRLAFAHANLCRDWSNVMFTDRKKFLFKYPGSKVQPVRWVYKGQKPQAYRVNNPQCVNVYAGITKQGVTSCRLVAGTSQLKSQYKTRQGQLARNITQQEYCDVLLKTLLPDGSRLLGRTARHTWVLQQDNDPAHRAAPKVVEQGSKGHTSACQLLANWPPNSPDLNPIENVWAWAEKRVLQQGCSTFPEFKKAVLDAIQGVTPDILRNLYASMPKRLKQVIDKGGDKTHY